MCVAMARCCDRMLLAPVRFGVVVTRALRRPSSVQFSFLCSSPLCFAAPPFVLAGARAYACATARLVALQELRPLAVRFWRTSSG